MLGGQSQLDEDNYLEGAPELVAEVAASIASIDLHDKKRIYRRNGVQEYIVGGCWRRNWIGLAWKLENMYCWSQMQQG